MKHLVLGERMFGFDRATRLISLVFALGLFIGPGVAHALGLGNFILRSGLDEPLVAEIEITSGSGDDLRKLKAGLASRAEFDAAGIERPALLSLIRFAVAERVDGSPILKLTTDEPIREPFLHLLLQIEWPGGRLVREFTTLLDPPHLAAAYGTQVSPPVIPAELPPEPELGGAQPEIELDLPPEVAGAAPVAAPAIPEAPMPTEPPVEVGATESASEVSIPPSGDLDPISDMETVAEVDPNRLLGPDNVEAISESAPSSTWASTTEYRVKRGDTLSKITGELIRDPTLSAEQVMIALLRTNKAAFFGNNVNNLKAGKILTIPPREAVETIPRSRALKEFRAQYNSWQEYKLKLASAAQVVKVDGADKGASRGEIAKHPTQANSDAGNTDLLKIVRAENDKSSTKGSAGEGAVLSAQERQRLVDRAATLEEAIASRELENKELRERVSQLEAQIKNATRLIEIENQALAKAQKEAKEDGATKGSGEAKAQAPIAAPPVVEPEKAVAPVETPASPPTASAETAAPPAEPTAPAAPIPPVASEESPPPAGLQEPEAGEAEESIVDTIMSAISSTISSVMEMVTGGGEDEAAGQDAGAAGEANTGDANTGDAELETSLLDNELLIPVAGGLLVFCLVVFVVYRRRRHKSMAEFGESILSGGLNMNSEGGVADGDKSADVSFLSDFSQGGMGNIHTDEVDPIAEAEVYLAYGRDEQAEEILRDAVIKDPSRHELRLKLMEIYQQRKDLGAFETVAEELYAALEGKGGKIWDKAEEMGYKMNPDNPLFRGGANPRSSDAGETTFEADGLMLQGAAPSAEPLIDLDLGHPGSDAGEAQQYEPTLNAPSSAPEEGFSLDLDFTASNNAPAGADSPSIAFESFSETDSSPAVEESQPMESGGIDFDFSALSASSEPEPEPEQSSEVLASSGEFDISFESTPEVSFESEAAPAAEVSGGGGLDLGDFSFESDDGEVATGIDVTSDDEIATKLDLAKAYIDMGDSDGARSILDEVLAEGSDDQKRQAADLASQIAA